MKLGRLLATEKGKNFIRGNKEGLKKTPKTHPTQTQDADFVTKTIF